MIKTYRGLLADGGQDRIRLSTIKGKVGYKIIKFQLMGNEPGEKHTEYTVKIYKNKQTTINNTVNFTDSDLLAAAYHQDNTGEQYPSSYEVIFDNEVVNQDVFITAEDTTGSGSADVINYYIELEVIPLDDAGAGRGAYACGNACTLTATAVRS